MFPKEVWFTPHACSPSPALFLSGIPCLEMVTLFYQSLKLKTLKSLLKFFLPYPLSTHIQFISKLCLPYFQCLLWVWPLFTAFTVQPFLVTITDCTAVTLWVSASLLSRLLTLACFPCGVQGDPFKTGANAPRFPEAPASRILLISYNDAWFVFLRDLPLSPTHDLWPHLLSFSSTSFPLTRSPSASEPSHLLFFA